MTYKLKDGFVLRKVGPMYMAVPFGTRASELKGMVSLSETGYLLWKALEAGTDTLEGLVAGLRGNGGGRGGEKKDEHQTFFDPPLPRSRRRRIRRRFSTACASREFWKHETRRA